MELLFGCNDFVVYQLNYQIMTPNYEQLIREITECIEKYNSTYNVTINATFILNPSGCIVIEDNDIVFNNTIKSY